ncbi:hypothetical protein GDO86_006872 [Hymenochirus boettgeri]|uniref:Fibrinogen C-terminal domain-containing protein n=1 Tax=Hymenochirus boettgeri TaxID=247094 RepID=A0A8T2JCA5_9PIPI|nr:hypothetical protein GDO86_006872 [Hymenochirus boettgeri]
MNVFGLVWLIMAPLLCQPHQAPHDSGSSEALHSRCTYTFVVPQQKMTGAVCISSGKYPISLGANRSEVQVLREELNRQHTEINELKKLSEIDHDLANEMEHLRKENKNMVSLLGQLQTQFSEVLQRKNESAEVIKAEDKGFNATLEVHKLASKYKDLQEKYNFLSSLINNQSTTIAHLEELCQQNSLQRQTGQNPAHSSVTKLSPSTDARLKHSGQIQADQMDLTLDIKKNVPTEQGPIETTSKPIIATEATKSLGPWLDCYDALHSNQKSSGIYLLKPQGGNQVMQAWCEQDISGGGWTVIQRRQDGSTNFFTTWHSYKHGFGNFNGEYWLGLENIYWLASQGSYKLLIIMEDWQGRHAKAEYDYFRLESESDFYRLRLGHYHGNAGDSLSWHSDKQFSTHDKDRDSYAGNCAHFHKGGWWYNMCAHSNLNGIWYRGGHYRSRYQDGVYWAEFRGGAYSLKKVSMMIKQNK